MHKGPIVRVKEEKCAVKDSLVCLTSSFLVLLQAAILDIRPVSALLATMDRNRVFINAICIFVVGVTSIQSIKQSRMPIRDCQISEFPCNNRRCISAEKYCDSVDDCGDGSDEPRFCSSKWKKLFSSLHVTA